MARQIVGKHSRFRRQRCHDVTPDLTASPEAVQKDDRLRASAAFDGIREWKHEKWWSEQDGQQSQIVAELLPNQTDGQ
ncbi:hypothetical protein LB572_29755 [Mesorhizobium sp. BH1-1-5]|uniref:hypothetical protein n=1 Tax=unclassified Mesorhizobium TaxID=325217 RepID=UPI001CCF4884|nr:MULTISPECIES: hypothetical protein [unclassified Mesorhizobium]MBZ9991282.1 hypothetical protein [Mesorhizobium sp. BH1-1-5]